MSDNTPDFQLSKNEHVSFKRLSETQIPYSKEHEDAIAEWAYQQSTQSEENFGFIEQIGSRILAVYDAYITMQMQLGIEPIYDLEVARSFKRIMGMTHDGVLKLQKLALSPEFSTFLTSINALDATQRKKLWNELANSQNRTLKSTLRNYFKKLKTRGKKTKGKFKNVKKAVNDFFKIPLELRNFDELKFVKIDKLPVLLDYAHRETYRKKDHIFTTLEGEKFEGIKVNREKIKQDKKLRILMEISQRNGSYATEEFDAISFKMPNTFKVGEISEVLSLLAHIDPTKRRKAARKRNITNDAVFRSVMTFMREQNFFINDVYKLPPRQFKVLNDHLEQRHGFRLTKDTNDVIQKALETGGGVYALYSNKNIRSSKSQDEKNEHYQSFGNTYNLALFDAVRNPSATERLRFANTKRPGIHRPPLHIFRGGDIFNVPEKACKIKSKKAKDYMRNVEQYGYPVSAGISGTTARLFAVAEALGLLKQEKNHSYLLTASIGYMVPLNHHSVYEIIITLKSFNIPYKHNLNLVDGICNFMRNEKLYKKMKELKPTRKRKREEPQLGYRLKRRLTYENP